MGPSQVTVLLATLACAYAMRSSTGGSTGSPSTSFNTFASQGQGQMGGQMGTQGQTGTQGQMGSQMGTQGQMGTSRNFFNTMSQRSMNPFGSSMYGQSQMSYPNPFAGMNYNTYGNYRQPAYNQYNRQGMYGNNMYGQSNYYRQPTNAWGQPSYQNNMYGGWGQRSPYTSPFTQWMGFNRNQQGQGQGRQQGAGQPLNPLMAYQQTQIREQVNSKLISYYKNNYGCQDGLNYVPNLLRAQHVANFAVGCSAAANMSCRFATFNRNPQSQVMYNQMTPSRRAMIEEVVNSLDIYTMVDQMKKKGMQVPATMLSAMATGGRGAAGAGAAGATAGFMGGAGGAAGMGAFGAGAAGLGAFGASASMGAGGMGGGNPMEAMQKVALARELRGMELSEAREMFFPYTCTEVGTTMKFGLCCPGNIDLAPEIQNQILLAGIA